MLLAAELIHTMDFSPYIRGESVRLPAIADGMWFLLMRQNWEKSAPWYQ